MELLTLIGYFPKKVELWPDCLKAANVREICSVSDCISEGPPDWIHHWKHNEMFAYSKISDALSILPPSERQAYQLHAYRVLPLRWRDGKEEPLVIPAVGAEPLPPDFESLGFDVVSIEDGIANFGCSPLSCNGMAEEIATNEYCLLDDIQTAKRTAMEFSRTKPEPGPYHVVEVLRQSTRYDGRKFRQSAMRTFNGVGPWAVGLTIWGSALAMMIRGLILGEWYGYVFAVLFASVLSGFLVLTRVMERRELKRCSSGSHP